MVQEMDNDLQDRNSLPVKVLTLWMILYVLIFMATSQFVPFWAIREKPVIWFGKTFLDLPDLTKIKATGSGDTAFDYVTVLVNIILSLIVALVVAIWDRKRKNYRQLFLSVIVLARYYVALTMLVYGFAKVFNGQFGPLGYTTLEEKFGDMSPMGVLWSFMDTSRYYTIFGGLLEVIGGCLLFFRKTKTFGALFSMTVMINVAVLNFTYDVPVKIFSVHIVLLCVFILAFDWRRLFNFFVRHRPETLEYQTLKVRKKWLQITLRVLKIAVIGTLFYMFFLSKLSGDTEKKAPLEGYYKTGRFVFRGDTLVADSRDTVRWNSMIIGNGGYASVGRQPKKVTWYRVRVDTAANTLALDSGRDKGKTYALFHYTLKRDTLSLKGQIGSDSTELSCIRKQMKDYLLTSRGFHWINDYPFNR